MSGWSVAMDPFGRQQHVVHAPHVIVVAQTAAGEAAARAALGAAGIRSSVATVRRHAVDAENDAVLIVAESPGDLDHDDVAAIDRDYVLLDQVPRELAVRVGLLRERALKRRTRLAAAESLRTQTMQLTWAIHTAETLPDLAAAATDGIRRIFGAKEVAVLVPADPADGSTLPVCWTSPGGESGELVEPLTTLASQYAQAGLEPPRTGPVVKPIVDLSPEQDRDVATALFDRDTRSVVLVPIGFDDSATGALLVADGASPARRTAFERSLFAYIGVQVGRATSELWLRDRQQQAEIELQKTSAELKRLLDEMGDLSVVIRSIADAVNVGVLFYDNENKPVLHNRMVERLLGLTGFDPATGLSHHVYASDRRTRVKQDKNIISETLEGDQRGLIYWVGDPEGEQRAIVTEAHAIARPNGERLGSAIVTYDVTDLANAIEIREEYLATVSHELRTPLTSIVGYLDLIDDGFDVDALGFGKEFRTIQRSATQMLALIRDLLSTSTRELALRIEPVDVSGLLTQSVTTFRPTLDAAHQVLQLEVPSGTVLAHLDAARIKQVVDNLISNAAKYTPEGGTIAVRLENEDDSIVIAVCDNGRGISKSDQSRLFDRFFRTRDAREAAIQGVGIGLTIVKTIVDAHGGTVKVDSEPGLGSTFTVRLPARAVSTPLTTLPMHP
ncbi:sensor histidine kinase [Rathayibacter sp. KR2-224]|uniref:sensor histidine kinase n=1 Tax=Rathayibacter sp. KR2-224 TaxID=3400913 RepID=UPI003C04C7E7